MQEQGTAVLIVGNTIVGDILKDGFVLSENNPLRKELFTLDEIDTMRKQYGIKRVIIIHLEEDWGKSYDDYRELERELNLIYFAYGGYCMLRKSHSFYLSSFYWFFESISISLPIPVYYVL